MWSIDVEEITADKQRELKIIINIKYDVFRNHLINKLKLFPQYIGYRFKWYYIRNPHQAFIDSDNNKESHIIKINEPVHIILPNNKKSIHIENYIESIGQSLLSWLEEEYLLYQKDWINIAKGTKLTFLTKGRHSL